MRFRALTERAAGCRIERAGFLFLTCLLALGSSVTVAFADSFTDNLSRLEQKFFQHDYPKDDKETRIERLEKLVFGEAKTGGDDARLQNLLSLVPNLNAKNEEGSPVAPPAASQPAPTETQTADSGYSGDNQSYSQPPTAQAPKSDSEPINNASSYPAVTAIEKKMLGRDYVGEPIGQRLGRLETKAFGKTMTDEDLQDRVDKLKASTGVDVAKVAPAGSDWADEEDDNIVQQPDLQPFTGVGGSRDYRRDAQNSVARQPRGSSGYQDEYAGTGTFGAGSVPGSSSSSSASSGRVASLGGMPPMAPDLVRGGGIAPAPAPAKLGMNQQLAVLEQEVFHKTYNNDTIPERLNRLETTVFPQDKVAAGKSLPDRLSRLVAAVPVSQPSSVAARPKVRRGDPDFAELDDMDIADGIPVAPPRGQGGLSKIINGLGNMLGGGGGTYMTGGYPTGGPGTLVTDPSTGMLYDQYTGTLIDPMTGAVVGRRSSMSPNYSSGFNSGFAPVNPYGMGGMGAGTGFGFGSSGLRFGSGMWP